MRMGYCTSSSHRHAVYTWQKYKHTAQTSTHVTREHTQTLMRARAACVRACMAYVPRCRCAERHSPTHTHSTQAATVVRCVPHSRHPQTSQPTSISPGRRHTTVTPPPHTTHSTLYVSGTSVGCDCDVRMTVDLSLSTFH